MVNGKENDIEKTKCRIRRNARLTPKVRLETKEKIINYWSKYDK